MKFVLFFATFLVFVDLSIQIPELKNCTSDFKLTDSMANGCGVVTCKGPGEIVAVDCGTWDCNADKYLGYKAADNSKPYPDCCGGPICAD